MATKKKKASIVPNILVGLFALVVGVVVGYVFASVYLTVDVNFYLKGKQEKNIGLDTTYKENGFVCEIKGEDYSSEVLIKYYDVDGNEVNNISTESLSTYYVKYILETTKISTVITRVVNIVEAEDLEIHFMTLGNKYNGDCIYIKAGETDILVDAGSRGNSADDIYAYIDDYVEDDTLEYVFATHADQDHIAAFVGTKKEKGLLFLDKLKIETIIDFPLSDSTSDVYNNYRDRVDELVQEGTIHYTALECYKEINGASKIIEVGVGIEIEILYNYYYENKHSDENNYSVCFMLRRGDEQFLFTGDLEKEGEAKLVEFYGNDLGEVYLYKSAHHGSSTSSSMALLEIIKPEVVVVPCVAFTSEYSEDKAIKFPSQNAIDNYKAVGVKELYVPSMVKYVNNEEEFELANGNIVVYSNKTTYVQCSNIQQCFYTFDIFIEYRGEWK